MPGGISVDQWVVAAVAIAIQGLRVAGGLDDGVGREEPGDSGIVVAGAGNFSKSVGIGRAFAMHGGSWACHSMKCYCEFFWKGFMSCRLR